MIRLLLLLSLSLCPAALPAQQWDWPAGVFQGAYPGLPLRFHDPEAPPRFAPDGSVRRPAAPGGGTTQLGAFTLQSDGRLCLSSAEMGGRCDLYMRDGWMQMLVTEGHGRLPFKFELGVGN